MHQHSTVNSNSAKVFVPLPDINVSKQQERECLILEETIIDSNGIQPSVQIDEPTKPEVNIIKCLQQPSQCNICILCVKLKS